MKNFPPWIAIPIILVLTGLACQTIFGLDAHRSGSVLFQDDFSDPSSGWQQGEDSLGVAEYIDGMFHILVTSDMAGKLTILNLRAFKDVRVEVDAAKIGGPDDNDFGIVCRYVDDANFYFFEISSDGYYGIGQYKENELFLIGADQMQSSEVIFQGATTNHLRADCVGDQLTMYVNDQIIAEVRDADFDSGYVGLIAGTFDTPGTEIAFDNFTLFKP